MRTPEEILVSLQALQDAYEKGCADKAKLEEELSELSRFLDEALDLTWEERCEAVGELEAERDALREKLQDLLNNELCTCQRFQNTPCPRCLVSISEAKAALKEEI